MVIILTFMVFLVCILRKTNSLIGLGPLIYKTHHIRDLQAKRTGANNVFICCIKKVYFDISTDLLSYKKGCFFKYV